MERKEKQSFLDQLTSMDPKIFIGLIAISGVLFGALLSGFLGGNSSSSKVPPTPTPRDPLAAAPTQFFVPTLVASTTPEINPFLEQTQQAAIAVTEEATVTETAIAPLLPTDVQFTATSAASLAGMQDQLSAQPVLLNDGFDDDQYGWTPYADTGFAVSIDNSAMQMFFSEPSYAPFLWTCDACGTFEHYAYQVDIKTAVDSGTIIAGLVFGSPSRIDQLPFQQAYALSIYSTGEMILQHISAGGIQTVQQWDKYHSQFKTDGNYHTLQVLADENKVAIFMDGKSLGDEIELAQSTSGYVGLVVQSTNQLVYYDNLQVIALP
ncbi:MAG: hypothetical protein JEZ00_12675 [Anaerolineaceae bacterium]|nr:hypothetical protein [Anaerolineaceae bacterium]